MKPEANGNQDEQDRDPLTHWGPVLEQFVRESRRKAAERELSQRAQKALQLLRGRGHWGSGAGRS